MMLLGIIVELISWEKWITHNMRLQKQTVRDRISSLVQLTSVWNSYYSKLKIRAWLRKLGMRLQLLWTFHWIKSRARHNTMYTVLCERISIVDSVFNKNLYNKLTTHKQHSFNEDMHKAMSFNVMWLTWYVPMPMCLGSILTSSAKGSWTRLPMDTEDKEKNTRKKKWSHHYV